MYHSLQTLRGIAAWGVVSTHIVQSYYMSQPPHELWNLAPKLGLLGIDVFFVISGFVMALTSERYNRKGLLFGANRIIRIMPIYWFYTGLLVASILVFPEGTYLTWWEGDSLAKSLFLIPNLNPNGYGYYPTLYVGWTLTFEMFFYLIFAVILFFGTKRPIRYCALVLIAIAIAFRSQPFLGNATLLLLEFVAGMGIYGYFSTSFGKRTTTVNVLVVLVLLAATTGLCLQYGLNLLSRSLIGTTAVFAFTLVEPMFERRGRFNAFLEQLGDVSYSTYLCHVIVIGWFYALVGTSENVFLDKVFVLGIVLCVFAVSWLSYRFIEDGALSRSLKRAARKLTAF